MCQTIVAVLLCSGMPACSLFCSSAPDPSTAPPSHTATCSVQGPSRKDTLQRRGEGAAGPMGQAGYEGWGWWVSAGGQSVDQPLWQIISVIGLAISLNKQRLGFLTMPLQSAGCTTWTQFGFPCDYVPMFTNIEPAKPPLKNSNSIWL